MVGGGGAPGWRLIGGTRLANGSASLVSLVVWRLLPIGEGIPNQTASDGGSQTGGRPTGTTLGPAECIKVARARFCMAVRAQPEPHSCAAPEVSH